MFSIISLLTGIMYLNPLQVPEGECFAGNLRRNGIINPSNRGAIVGDSMLEIGYIANMGVILESGEKTVVIDGFHEAYKPDYLYPTEQMVEDLCRGRYLDFSPIEICLVTHNHRDHFSAKLVAKFLQENAGSLLIGPGQVGQVVRKMDRIQSTLGNQIREIAHVHQVQSIEHEGIKIKAIRCDHTNPSRHRDIQNIAYLVELGGFSILHVGDSNWDLSEKSLSDLDLINQDLDIAILPYWWLFGTAAEDKVAQFLAPDKIIATHVPPDFDSEMAKDLLAIYSNLTIFGVLGETIQHKK